MPTSTLPMHASLPVRLLLRTDGSVTTLLEASFGARVEVVTLANTVDDRLPTPFELRLERGRPALWRQAVLHVAGRPVLRARSVLALERLDPRARSALLAGDEPIGSVLRGLETRRDLLRTSAVAATPADEAELEVDQDDPMFERTSRILSASRPLAVVIERIPASIFDSL
jgi:chorismate-pyruvate lyase